ncbi:DedA family protein [Patescibacteria group bacterium]|nr:DedA family protein [Patescibacteria group bacterium]
MEIINYFAEIIVKVIEFSGYPGIFFLMAIESCGIPAPSEVTMPFSGFLVAAGKMNLYYVILAGTLGNVVGSIAAYWIGLKGGRPLIEKYGKYIFLSKHDLDKAEEWFAKRGEITVFLGRLLPVVRTYISFPAGIAEMNFKKFVFYTTIGVLPWCALFAYLGERAGSNWDLIREKLHGLDVGVALALAAGIIVYIIIKKRKSKVKN